MLLAHRKPARLKGQRSSHDVNLCVMSLWACNFWTERARKLDTHVVCDICNKGQEVED